MGGGLRFDEFRYDVADKVNPNQSGVKSAGKWQGKGNAAFTPSHSVPLTLYANYGRGINSIDARGVVQRPDEPRLATTDFYQFGTSSNFGRFRSQYRCVPDRSFERAGIHPRRWQLRVQGPEQSLWIRSQSIGATHTARVAERRHDQNRQRFFQGRRPPRLCGQRAAFCRERRAHRCGVAWLERLAAHARHQSLSARRRTTLPIVASGHTVFDMGVAKQVRHGVELNLSMDNLTNRDYYRDSELFRVAGYSDRTRRSPNPCHARISS